MEMHIKYIDENGDVRETTLDDVISNIGFDHSIPDDVLKLSSCIRISQIKINGVIKWLDSKCH